MSTVYILPTSEMDYNHSNTILVEFWYIKKLSQAIGGWDPIYRPIWLDHYPLDWGRHVQIVSSWLSQDPRHSQPLTAWIPKITGSWLIQINCSGILGDLEDMSWLIPVIAEFSWDWIHFDTQIIFMVWRSRECEVDRDLDKDNLEVGCSSHVYADLASVLHVVPFLCHVKRSHNT